MHCGQAADISMTLHANHAGRSDCHKSDMLNGFIAAALLP